VAERLGIALERIRPGRPQENGRHERMHRTLKAETTRPAGANPFHDRDIIVTTCGRICMMRKKINISHVLAGQKLGIKEVDDGIWLVSFMRYDLGYIDLEQSTLQTIDNPFGTRLSPMS
jgi:transposase InsO family protein